MASNFALIVDSDQASVKNAADILVGMGFASVRSTASFNDAVLIMEEGLPRLVVVDLNLSKSAGIALVDKILNHPVGAIRTMPVLGLSGYRGMDLERFIAEHPTLNVSQKPITEVLFREAVIEVMAGTDMVLKGAASAVEKAKSQTEEKRRRETMRAVTTQMINGDLEHAEALIRRAIADEEPCAYLQSILAEVCFSRSNVAEAKRATAEALRINPASVVAISMQARLALHSGDATEALRCLEKAQSLSPLSVRRLVAMGEIHLANGRMNAAEDKFRRAHQAMPESDEAKIGLAKLMIEKGQDEEGRALLMDISNPGSVASDLNMRAVILAKTGHHKEAIRLYNEALKYIVNPEKEKNILYNIAMAHARSGSSHMAIKFLERSIKIDSGYQKAESLLMKITRNKEYIFQLAAVKPTDTVNLPTNKVNVLLGAFAADAKIASQASVVEEEPEEPKTSQNAAQRCLQQECIESILAEIEAARAEEGL